MISIMQSMSKTCDYLTAMMKKDHILIIVMKR